MHRGPAGSAFVGLVFGALVVGAAGGAVIGCEFVLVLSLQPQNFPGVAHVVLDEHVVCDVDVGTKRVEVTVCDVVVVVLSLHPNHPGVLQVFVN